MPIDRERVRQYLSMAGKEALIEAILERSFEPEEVAILALGNEMQRRQNTAGALIDAGWGECGILAWIDRINRHWRRVDKARAAMIKLNDEVRR